MSALRWDGLAKLGADIRHYSQIVAEVVDGVEDLRQDFVGRIQVAQVGAGVALANFTGAIGVERPLVLGVP